MRNLFNGTCDGCQTFKPRCAYVIIRDGWPKGTLCADCRKFPLYKGVRLDPKHTKEPRDGR